MRTLGFIGTGGMGGGMAATLFILRYPAFPGHLIYMARCGLFKGGLWPSILNRRSLLKDVAESLNQWAVAD